MERIPRLDRVTSASEVPQLRKVPELIRVPALEPIVGVVLSDAIFALRTHYVTGRTRVCPGETRCEHCGKLSMKWYGLLAVHARTDSQAKWVQLTAQATDSLLRQLEELQLPLFGCNVRIARERKVKNAPISIIVDTNARTVSKLPKPLDPQETIERVFGSPEPSRTNGRKAV